MALPESENREAPNAPVLLLAGASGYVGGRLIPLLEQQPVILRCLPIAVDDVLAYLLAAKDLPPADSRIFEIGSPDVTTYGGIIREYARQRGLRRWLISVPVLTPYLSSLWLALVTPTAFDVGRPLIEGLKNPTVVRDTKALESFQIRPMGIREAIQKALASTTE